MTQSDQHGLIQLDEHYYQEQSRVHNSFAIWVGHDGIHNHMVLQASLGKYTQGPLGTVPLWVLSPSLTLAWWQMPRSQTGLAKPY
jgi:hypothetical protein